MRKISKQSLQLLQSQDNFRYVVISIKFDLRCVLFIEQQERSTCKTKPTTFMSAVCHEFNAKSIEQFKIDLSSVGSDKHIHIIIIPAPWIWGVESWILFIPKESKLEMRTKISRIKSIRLKLKNSSCNSKFCETKLTTALFATNGTVPKIGPRPQNFFLFRFCWKKF